MGEMLYTHIFGFCLLIDFFSFLGPTILPALIKNSNIKYQNKSSRNVSIKHIRSNYDVDPVFTLEDNEQAQNHIDLLLTEILNISNNFTHLTQLTPDWGSE